MGVVVSFYSFYNLMRNENRCFVVVVMKMWAWQAKDIT